MIQYDIIRRPLLTEKTNRQKSDANQLTFEVSPDANRIEVQRAIEKIFNVRVSKIRTLNVLGKKKRRGRVIGKRKDWKKAIVTLKPGERIEFFEGA